MSRTEFDHMDFIDEIRSHIKRHTSGFDRKQIGAIGRKVAKDLFAEAKAVDSGHGLCVVNQMAVVVDVCAAIIVECGESIFEAAIQKDDEIRAAARTVGVALPGIDPQLCELCCSAVLAEVTQRTVQIAFASIERRVEAQRTGSTATVN